MSVKDIISNDLVQDESSVWVLKEHSDFGYSDGVESEKYLENVFRNAKDLSSSSEELENYIKDWPSEYHLTVKRSQLFAGFDFDPSLKVLEVGCGCGAITRYLGETFSDVVSIEGSISRARLARLRTKDLENVSIICAPFQEIEFLKKFDIIFCVGVYEYSASFVAGDDPYDSVLHYFSNMLSSEGICVIAIENQFGLKYFNSTREDHTNTLFEGLEGYHVHGNKVKTFGKYELEDNLRKYFKSLKFYYPYPDYKLPDCVIADDFLKSGRAGELVSQLRSRDYYGEIQRSWDESLVSLELAKNGMLSFFANSFLVFAGKSEIVGASFDQLAVLGTPKRTEKFRTQTRIYRDDDDEVIVSKKIISGDSVVIDGNLQLVESMSIWKESFSLQTVLYRNCMSIKMDLVEMFMPAKAWVEFLEGMSENVNGHKYLSGEYVDCIWSNIYEGKGEISIIDKEWVWKEKVRFNIVIIRSIFIFLCKLQNTNNLSRLLNVESLKTMIALISKSIGVKIDNKDFSDFVEFESGFQSLVHGSKKENNAIALKRLLFYGSLFRFLTNLKKAGGKVTRYVKRLIVPLYRLFARGMGTLVMPRK